MYRSTFHNKHHNRIITWVITLSLTLMLMVSVVGVAQAAGTVTGLVFRDYNANGVQDANEPGVGGVTVTAYGAANTVVGTAATSTALTTVGTYSISWASADITVRLEFTNLPGIAQQGAFSGAAGGSGTSVQFVSTGAVANYGINRPSDYCLATPNLQLVTTCFELGAQTTGTERVVVSHNYDGTGGDNTIAVDTQVGTTWGVAYKRAPVGSAVGSGTIYVSAFAKRQADYSPNGSGAIYAIDGTTLASTLVTTLNAGPTVHSNVPSYAVDATFYAAPGKEGLGDMDISEDGNTLFVVNLFDQQLYSIDIATGTPTARGIIGPAAGTCVNGEYRPFGLGVRDGLVYVGGVCTAENEPVSATMSNSLQAFVYSFNPATNVSAPVLNFPLNYPRGCTDIFAGYGSPIAPQQCRAVPIPTNGSRAAWQPWRDTWPNPDQTPPGSGFSAADSFFAYPQPILAGIEFVGEDMVVSFRDRMGDQIGYEDNGPNGTFPPLLVTITAGDILRASPNGLGGWTIEDNARANPSVPGTFGPSAGANSEEGPGNGEFYWQDNLVGSHDETITGGIVQVAGAPEISAEIMDPGATFSAGTGWFDNGTGNRNREFTIIPATAPFGKGNGLGDLAALCDSAPIEIGNYVWFDANQNGIQDANEQPLTGIIVTLTDPLGNPILLNGNPLTPVTATTDAQGRYVFSSNTGGAAGSFIYGVPFTENTNYQVRIDTTQPNLASYTTTTPNGAGVADAARDSNGVTAGNFAIADVTTGTAGQNDHTIDFGFFTPPYSLGNRVWLDNGTGGGTPNDGIQNGTEPGIDGVTVNLLDNLGNVIATTVTTAGGYYRFDNLAPGSYTVEIPGSNFIGAGPLAGLASSADAPTSALPDNDVDRDDNGVNLVGGGVRSNPILLGPPGPVEPSGETDLGPGGSGTAANDHSNLTVDFGFFGTPINPPVATPAAGTPGPAPIRLDPAIVKLVDPAFALPGEDVRWTIVVTNPHSVAINNVTFVDNFPSQLEIISTSADNNVGSLVVSGNTVTYSIVVINPGQSVRVSVLTRIRVGTPVPFIITNTVNLTNGLVGSSSSIISSASATVLSVGSLPATGFAPAWREPLLVGIAVLLMLFGIGAVRTRQRRYSNL